MVRPQSLAFLSIISIVCEEGVAGLIMLAKVSINLAIILGVGLFSWGATFCR